MQKCKLIILLVLLLPIVYAGLEVQYSTDNSTWYNITNANTNLKEGYQIALDQDTQYYFRGRNDTTSWGYTEQRTKEGMDNMLAVGVMIFLMVINAVAFGLPFWVKKFGGSKVSDYVIKRLIWLGSFVLLWFNMLIVRVLIDDKGLGIDDHLRAYWLVFTLGMFIVIFVSTYFMLVGMLKLMKEVKMRKRMGYDEPEY